MGAVTQDRAASAEGARSEAASVNEPAEVGGADRAKASEAVVAAGSARRRTHNLRAVPSLGSVLLGGSLLAGPAPLLTQVVLVTLPLLLVLASSQGSLQ